MKSVIKPPIGCLFLLLAFALSQGCGSATRESPAQVETGVSKVGITECFKCHSDSQNPATLKAVFGDTNIGSGNAGWMNSRHYNTNSSPSYSDADLTSSCETCHDPKADGQTIRDFYLDTANTAFGTSNRPMAGCENCHGNGGNHYGVGQLPYSPPDASRCGVCHNENFPHTSTHPEGINIYADYAASPHATSVNSSVLVSGSTTDVTARCSRCHTDEGARRYTQLIGGTGTYSEIRTAMTDQSNIAAASPVQCRTCHDSHNPSIYIHSKDSTSVPSTWTNSFKVCNECHQYLKADGTVNAQSYHNPSVNSFGDASEMIYDTHYDDPATTDIEGYVLDASATHDPASGNSNRGTCLDCHNQHDTRTTIHSQWAQSAHSGKIATVKASDSSAAVGESTGPAWMHYDFKQSNRAACQRCHTATGFRNYASDTANYSSAANSFVASGNQKEMLYCWACHTDNKGTLRNPGAITADYTNAPYTYADASGSNICMACHTGRESGESIKNDTGNFSSRGFINSHYLSAGGTVFAATGYEYSGRTYANVSFYEHDTIGLTAANTGSNGPCAGCHMSSSEPHKFLPVATDDSGTITSITTDVCTNCHAGQYSMTAAQLEEQRELMANTMEALRAQLQEAGYTYTTAYPYFSNRNWLSTGDTDTTGGVTGKNNMGAAFNYNLLLHDPGAYAHNRYYAKRLIYDSIDWLDDNALNDSVSATLSGAPHSGTSYVAGARTYLLVNNVAGR